jgi:zinc and cadmium transporter
MSPVGLLILYCLLILLASLLGGWVPLLVRLTHRRMELLVSFVSGVMLGVAVLHLLPHAWMQRAEWLQRSGAEPAVGHELIGPVVWWLLIGFLAMFFVERFFCFHHHDASPTGDQAEPPPSHARHGHELTWTGAAIGLSLHSLMAGLALAASVEIGEGASTGAAIVWTTGFSTFLAIFLHKPFDSMTLGALMAVGRRSTRARHLVNVAFGLVVPAGVGLFFLGAGAEGVEGSWLASCVLAFSAGTFLCISLSDLLPELQFHQHDRLKLSGALLLGLALAWATARVEARHHDDAAAAVGRVVAAADAGLDLNP